MQESPRQHALSVYLPMDRRHALREGSALPEHTQGAALFADISGFTPLMEALVHTLGPRQGVEAMSQQLDLFYDALIAEVDRFGGSVIGFAGDAMTCWFDGDDGRAALACAMAMQQAIARLSAVDLPTGETHALAMKVAVVQGAVRRLLVGDPTIQYLEVLTGKTLERMAAAEQQARAGEVLLDEASALPLASLLDLAEWRVAPGGGARFAVVRGLQVPVEPRPWPPLPPESLQPEQVRAWLLPLIYHRMQEGLGELLAELRPVAVLFLRFEGLDYEREEAAAQLDGYVRWVQSIIREYEGTLLDLTVGDKGSYLYAAFGAPLAHEDDAQRAVSAALRLRALPAELEFIHTIQIGISTGVTRVGSYGGRTRRTYGVLGDEANVAARLMQHATAGEVLVSDRVWKALGDRFLGESLPPVQVKGKQQPIAVTRLLGRATALPLRSPTQVEALLGREAEVRQLLHWLNPLDEGRSAGLLIVYGAAGVGKSALAQALCEQLGRRGVRWFTGAAEGMLRQSLHPFSHFLREYFGLAPNKTEAENKTRFTTALDKLLAYHMRPSGPVVALAREVERTRSFLGAMVGLRWSGSLYERVEPRLRLENTLSGLKALLLVESLRQPFVLHLEDAHWLDEDSQRLLPGLLRSVQEYPFALLLTSRYRDDGSHLPLDETDARPKRVLELGELSAEAIPAMVALRLGGTPTEALKTFVAEKSGGVPLFIEQLLLDLREREVISRDQEGRWQIIAPERVEVPASLNALLIARLDRLQAHVKAVVQTAAVLGQSFEVRVLSQMLKDDAGLPAKLREAESEIIWVALDELHYLFKHALLRDAAYEMQLRARLRELHALAATAIEQIARASDSPAEYYADLVYHYGQAEDSPHERHYARLAGEQAAARFANSKAIAYLSRALALTPEDARRERFELLHLREQLYDLQGARQAQRAELEALAALAEQLEDAPCRARVAVGYAAYWVATYDYPAAISAAQRAIELARQAGSVTDEIAGHMLWGRALLQQPDFPAAREQFDLALALARHHHLPREEATSLRNLGSVGYGVGDYAASQRFYENALERYRAIDDKHGESITLNYLGIIFKNRGDLLSARTHYEQGLQLYQEMGDRYQESHVLNSLGIVLDLLGNPAEARSHCEAALALCQEIENRRGEGNALGNLGDIALRQGALEEAEHYYEQALALYRAIGNRWGESISLENLGRVAFERGEYARAQPYYEQSLVICQEIGDRPARGMRCSRWGCSSITWERTSRPAPAARRPSPSPRRSVPATARRGPGSTWATRWRAWARRRRRSIATSRHSRSPWKAKSPSCWPRYRPR